MHWFEFVNKTRIQINTQEFQYGNKYQLTTDGKIVHFHSLDTFTQETIFRYVILINGWKPTDEIIARCTNKADIIYNKTDDDTNNKLDTIK